MSSAPLLDVVGCNGSCSRPVASFKTRAASALPPRWGRSCVNRSLESESNTKAGANRNISDVALFPSTTHQEKMVMTGIGTMTAACLAVALAATSPVFARGGHVGGGGGRVGGGGFHAGAAHYAGGGMRGGGFRRGGYGPGIAGAGIAAGIVAGSVIGATSGYYGGPGYYGNSYAYDNGYGGGYDNGYAARNGFVCQPGTVFRGEDGRTHLCQ